MARDDPRSVILRRRALLIGSALGALGCPREPAEDSPTVVDVPPAGSEAAMPEPEGRVVKTEPTDDRGKMPPLDVPSDAKDPARGMYDHLAKTVPELHERLDLIERSMIPKSCKLEDPACLDAWEALVDELSTIDRQIENLLPLCTGRSPEAQRYLERAKAHHEFAKKRRAAIDTGIDRQLAGQGKTAQARWLELKRKTRVMMRPCLSCVDW